MGSEHLPVGGETSSEQELQPALVWSAMKNTALSVFSFLKTALFVVSVIETHCTNESLTLGDGGMNMCVLIIWKSI